RRVVRQVQLRLKRIEGDVQRELELRSTPIQRDQLLDNARQLEAFGLHVRNVEQHLRKWRAAGIAGGLQLLQQDLEGYVLVREGIQSRPTNHGQELTKRP